MCCGVGPPDAVPVPSLEEEACCCVLQRSNTYAVVQRFDGRRVVVVVVVGEGKEALGQEGAVAAHAGFGR